MNPGALAKEVGCPELLLREAELAEAAGDTVTSKAYASKAVEAIKAAKQ